jgi:hypothetical protein
MDTLGQSLVAAGTNTVANEATINLVQRDLGLGASTPIAGA